MQKGFFWQLWPTQEKIRFLFFLTLTFLLVLLYGYGFFFGEDITFQWLIEQDPEELELPLTSFYFWGYEFSYPAVFFLIFQKFHGAAPQIIPAWSGIFILVTFTALSLILAVLTGLSRIWYIVSMALFILLVNSFELGGLLFMGKSGNTFLIITVAGYLVISYYFHAFNSAISLWARFLAFLAWALTLGFVVYLAAGIEHPFTYLAANGISSVILISVLFIMLIAHEIIYLFIYLITSANTANSRNSVSHFLIITIIYLVVLLLTWLTNIRFFEADLKFINAFLILVISFLIGIFGFKDREVLYDNLVAFRPGGAMLYLGLAMITFCTIGFSAITANDPLIESFEDVIIFSHLGFGIAFFIYIIANFIDLLAENFKVYKVVYQPKRMPYFTYRLAGVVIMLAFFLQSGRISYEQARAGKYNYLGDYYQLTGEDILAEEFYNEGSIFGNFNHRSNYSLASIYRDRNELGSEQYVLKQAVKKNPTTYAYINLANSYYRDGKFFDALFILREALQQFPGSGPVRNALGLIFSKTNLLDSAVFYFETAAASDEAGDEAKANFYGLLAEKDLAEPDDELLSWFENSGIVGQSNLLGVLKQMDIQLTNSNDFITPFLTDTALTLEHFTFLNNLLLNQSSRLDSATMTYFADQFSGSNASYQEYLRLAAALGWNENAFYTNALQVLRRLRFNGVIETEYILQLMAYLAMENNAHWLAREYLFDAIDLRAYDLALPAALSLVAGDSIEQAQRLIVYLDSLQNYDTDWVEIIKNIDKDIPEAELVSKEIYLRILNSGSEEKESKLNKVQKLESSLQKLAFIHFSNAAYRDNNVDEAEFWLDKFEQSPADDPSLRRDARILKTKILWTKKEYDALRDLFNTDQVEKFPTFYRDFVAGSLSLAAGDSAEAGEYFARISNQNPFFEQGTIFMADFFLKANQEEKAYDILLNSIKNNPYSAELLKAYIDAALKLGLQQYALDAIAEFNQIRPELASQIIQYYENQKSR